MADGNPHPSPQPRLTAKSNPGSSGWRFPGWCQKLVQEDDDDDDDVGASDDMSTMIRGVSHAGSSNKTKTTSELVMNVSGKIEGKTAPEEDEEEENVGRTIPVVLALEHSNANGNGNGAANECKWRNKKLGSNRAKSGSSWVPTPPAPPPQTEITSTPSSSSTKLNHDNSNTTHQKEYIVNAIDDGGSNRLGPQPLAPVDNNKLKSGAVEKLKKNGDDDDGGGEEDGGMRLWHHPFTFNLGFLKAKLNEMNWQA